MGRIGGEEGDKDEGDEGDDSVVGDRVLICVMRMWIDEIYCVVDI